MWQFLQVGSIVVLYYILIISYDKRT